MTARAYELRCSRCRESVSEVATVRRAPDAEPEELCRLCYDEAETVFAAETGNSPRPWQPSIRTFSPGNTTTLGDTIAEPEAFIGGVRWVQTGPGEWDVDGKTFPGASQHDTDLAIAEVLRLRRELAEAAKQINCAGAGAHRIRVLRKEHAEEVAELRQTIREAFDHNDVQTGRANHNRIALHSLCLVVSEFLFGNADKTTLLAAYGDAFRVLHPEHNEPAHPAPYEPTEPGPARLRGDRFGADR